jgi:glycosyltransferase involved in cell wall biosynthesis
MAAQAVRQIELTSRAARPPVDVTVIVPVAERCDDLVEVYRQHAAVLKRAGRRYEFIVVVDQGFEAAARPLLDLAAAGEPLRVIALPRRFGEATALTVGFREARAEVIVTVPAYFQTEPEGLAPVLARLEAGEDLVIGRRWPRTDSWVNRLQSAAFHAIARRVGGVGLRDVSSGLRAMRKGVTR